MLALPVTVLLACSGGQMVVPDDSARPVDCVPVSEVCDGLDNDCDGLVDDADPDRVGATNWFLDADGDGYGDPAHLDEACVQPSMMVADATDCDDANPDVHPDADEVCDDIDDDCDTLVLRLAAPLPPTG